MIDLSLLSYLRYCRLRFTLRAERAEAFLVDSAAGKLVQGRLGAALKHAVYAHLPPALVCEDDACLRPKSCPYEQFFKSKRLPGAGGKPLGSDPPRPYALELPARLHPGLPMSSLAYPADETLRFDLLLIGRGIDY